MALYSRDMTNIGMTDSGSEQAAGDKKEQARAQSAAARAQSVAEQAKKDYIEELNAKIKKLDKEIEELDEEIQEYSNVKSAIMEADGYLGEVDIITIGTTLKFAYNGAHAKEYIQQTVKAEADIKINKSTIKEIKGEIDTEIKDLKKEKEKKRRERTKLKIQLSEI